MPRQGRTLASRILVAVLGIIGFTTALGFALYSARTSQMTDQQAVQQARSIAATVGNVPEVATAVVDGDPHNVLAGLGEAIRRDSGASYVVIIDAAGVRHSHPNPALIGQRIEEPVEALDGAVHTGVDQGTLGRSANARAPIVDSSGRPVGEVSVGILESEVSSRFSQLMGPILAYTVLALALGVVASWILARAIKRVTFGLEPAEIVALMQEREAMLHGIREGVLAVDRHGRVNVLNDEARRLLGLTGARLGRHLEAILPEGRLRDVVAGALTGPDQVVLTDEHLLVVNRMPVIVAGRNAGWVVTIRDRTELEGLVRQLDSVESLTSALRAQEHEFSNRLHVVSVLLELGEVEEATRYAVALRAETTGTAEEVRSRIASPVVAALLIAKITLGAERDVVVRLGASSRLSDPDADAGPLVTVLGNLVDNAIDAVADDDRSVGQHPRGEVLVEMSVDGATLRLAVADTGPGIPADVLPSIFTDGFTTKSPRQGMRRGVGLALVHRLVSRAGGTISASSSPGARFEVALPLRVRQGTG